MVWRGQAQIALGHLTIGQRCVTEVHQRRMAERSTKVEKSMAGSSPSCDGGPPSLCCASLLGLAHVPIRCPSGASQVSGTATGGMPLTLGGAMEDTTPEIAGCARVMFSTFAAKCGQLFQVFLDVFLYVKDPACANSGSVPEHRRSQGVF